MMSISITFVFSRPMRSLRVWCVSRLCVYKRPAFSHSKTEKRIFELCQRDRQNPFIHRPLRTTSRNAKLDIILFVHCLLTTRVYSLFFSVYICIVTGARVFGVSCMYTISLYSKIQPQDIHVHILLFKGQTLSQSTCTVYTRKHCYLVMINDIIMYGFVGWLNKSMIVFENCNDKIANNRITLQTNYILLS